MLNIILCGYNGAMGKHLIEQIEASAELKISGGVDRTFNPSFSFPQFTDFDLQNLSGDVIIDFSHHSVVPKLLDFAEEKKIPAVICTTGLSAEVNAQIEAVSRSVALFKSGNMSLGINLLIHLSQKAAEILGEDYDIEIIEKHHRRKLDAPSGTALMLADGINAVCQKQYQYQMGRQGTDAKRKPKEIGIHAVRGGNIVGEHEVMFAGLEEVITLTHSAASRGVFAKGAIRAAEYLVTQPPGLYNMNHMLAEVLAI